MRKKLLYVLILSSLIGTSCSKSETPITAASNKSASQTIEVIKSQPKSSNQIQLPNFAKLVKEVGNTVVNITAETTVQANDPNIDPFFELFRQFGQPIPRTRPQPRVKTSMGSGFIISKDGYILTNAHVVDMAKKITVKTTDKREFQAKLVGLDAKTDIALLKVDANNLNAVRIGDPNKLEVGEWVAAIGAPFGFDNTVTQGIVSAKGRNIAADTIVPFIQTDVPINPGNSGGPLFNLNEEVVGINSQIYSRSGGYMGISFSIPIDIAINIANQLKAHGHATHGMLGVQVQAVTAQLAQSFGLKAPTGALVAQVLPNSAAAKAGLKPGDIILQVDGKDVSDSANLPLIIGSKHPGEVVTLLVFRNKQDITIKAILSGDGQKEDNKSKTNVQKSDNSIKLDKFGITISNLDEKLKQQLNINNGVIITNAENVAMMAGLQPNDIILAVENKDITNVNQVKDILQGKNLAAFLIMRDNQRMYVTINVGQ